MTALERGARVTLSRVVEPGDEVCGRWIGEVGAPEAVRWLYGERERPRGMTDRRWAGLRARAARADPERDLELARSAGVGFVCPGEPDWPAQLDDLGDARPVGLWVRGRPGLRLWALRSVAVVGARACTEYGAHMAATLGAGLAERGWVVVSGGAYGIDAAAHRGALAAGGTTVLVSAGGLDSPYPPSHAGLFERVATTGLLLSESPPGSSPQRRRFLTRNRLIAALATGTIVVEASLRSGASNTAGHCTRLQRPLMAVPGPVTSAVSAGCHALISADDDPARLVTGVDDVVALIGSASDVPATGPGREPSGDDLRGRLDLLDDVSRHVFDGFRAGRVLTCDELAVASGVNALDVIRALPALQLAGLVEGVDGGFRICAAVARASRRHAVGPK